MNTRELAGAKLDYWTARAEGEPAVMQHLPLGEARTFMGQPSPLPGEPK